MMYIVYENVYDEELSSTAILYVTKDANKAVAIEEKYKIIEARRKERLAELVVMNVDEMSQELYDELIES